MYTRISRSGGRSYLQLVEGYRTDTGTVRQRLVATLGRLDQLGPKNLDPLIQVLDPFGLVNLNLFPPGSPIYIGANNIAIEYNDFSVGIHGNSFYFGNPITGKPLRASALAKLIEADFAFHQGETVTLYSCNAGLNLHNGTLSAAQQLANDLNSPVKGADNFVWIPTNGDYFIGGARSGMTEFTATSAAESMGPSYLEPGQFITYYPTYLLSNGQ